MLSALIIAASLTAAPPFDLSWIEFSRSPALNSATDRVELGTLGMDRNGKELLYWLRRSVTIRDQVTVTWVDSRTCPAVRGALVALQSLPMPRPAPYGLGGDNTDIILDGVSYSLRIPAAYGRQGAQLMLSSNVGTPLAAWVEASFAALEPCWSPRPPVLP